MSPQVRAGSRAARRLWLPGHLISVCQERPHLPSADARPCTLRGGWGMPWHSTLGAVALRCTGSRLGSVGRAGGGWGSGRGPPARNLALEVGKPPSIPAAPLRSVSRDSSAAATQVDSGVRRRARSRGRAGCRPTSMQLVEECWCKAHACQQLAHARPPPAGPAGAAATPREPEVAPSRIPQHASVIQASAPAQATTAVQTQVGPLSRSDPQHSAGRRATLPISSWGAELFRATVRSPVLRYRAATAAPPPLPRRRCAAAPLAWPRPLAGMRAATTAPLVLLVLSAVGNALAAEPAGRAGCSEALGEQGASRLLGERMPRRRQSAIGPLAISSCQPRNP